MTMIMIIIIKIFKLFVFWGTEQCSTKHGNCPLSKILLVADNVVLLLLLLFVGVIVKLSIKVAYLQKTV